MSSDEQRGYEWEKGRMRARANIAAKLVLAICAAFVLMVLLALILWPIAWGVHKLTAGPSSLEPFETQWDVRPTQPHGKIP